MYCVKCKKPNDNGSAKGIVAALVAVIVVIIVVLVVVYVSNSATSTLNKTIESGDIDAAANYYLDKFEEKGKDLPDKTIELLKSGIAQIKTNYQAGDLTAEAAFTDLVAYRPFKSAGIEDEYEELYLILTNAINDASDEE